MGAFGGIGFCCCEPTPCLTTRACCETASRVVWKLDAGDVAAGSVTTCADQCCVNLSGSPWWMAHSSRLRAKHYDSELAFDGWAATGMVWPAGPDDDGAETACVWGSGDIDNMTSATPGPEDFVPVRQMVCGDPCDDFDADQRTDIAGDLGVHIAPAWVFFQQCRGAGETYETRLVAVGQVMNLIFFCSGVFPGWSWFAHARYATAWMSSAAMQALVDAATATPITLNLVTITNGTYDPTCPDGGVGDPIVVPSPYGCSFPASVSLSRTSDAVEQVAGGCQSACDPSALEDGDYSVLHFDGTIGGVAVHLCLAYEGFSELLATPVWFGQGEVLLGCGTKEYEVRVYCGLLNPEDTERQWLVEITNVATAASEKFPLEITTEDPLDATASGTVTVLCGSDAMVADVSACGGDLPLLDCCPDAGAALCCLDEIGAEGEFISIGDECIPPGCTTSIESLGSGSGPILCGGTPIAPTGFDSSKVYFLGPVPFTTINGLYAGHKVLLYCGGGMKCAILNASNCVTEEHVVSDWDCETMTGSVNLGPNADVCCTSDETFFYAHEIVIHFG